MRNFIKKVSLIIMGLTTMITMSGCSMVNQMTGNKVCAALEEKYGEPFVATRIGDRINTGSATLIVHPADNEDLLFTAKIYKGTGEVEDDYIEEKVNAQVEEILKDSFAQYGITASSRCMVVTRNPIAFENYEYTPKSFSEEYGLDDYYILIMLKDGEYSASDILNAVKLTHETVGVKLVIGGYILDDKGYFECVSYMKTNPEINDTIIKNKSPICLFSLNVNQGVCSITEDELSEKLGRS